MDVMEQEDTSVPKLQVVEGPPEHFRSIARAASACYRSCHQGWCGGCNILRLLKDTVAVV